jgi:hypothetical protein
MTNEPAAQPASSAATAKPASSAGPTRGVIYIVWNIRGNDRLIAKLERSVASLHAHHPGIPTTIKDLGPGATLLDKSQMLDLSPYDETLFLDADTEVLDDLTFGFDMARRHGLACVICEAPYARRYQNAIAGDVIEYNTGVLFFTKAPRVRAVFDRWKSLAHTMDSSLRHWSDGGLVTMPLNDQGPFAKAVDELGYNPFALPMNWNFRPQWQRTGFGPVKIWHDSTPAPASLKSFNVAMRTSPALGFFDLGFEAARAQFAGAM